MDWQSTRVWRALPPVVNRLMRFWLRSGSHRPVSSSMMVLIFKGARSGRVYSFPTGYAEDAEGLVTFTRFDWWKNFRGGRPVSLRLRGREVRGTAVAVRDLFGIAVSTRSNYVRDTVSDSVCVSIDFQFLGSRSYLTARTGLRLSAILLTIPPTRTGP
jgi:hypothetical protein